MERNIKIEDDLQERIYGAITEVESLIKDFLKENEDWSGDSYELFDKLDYNGGITEQIDSAVPIYCHNIDGLWYLYKHEFIEAYNNAGIGNDFFSNSGMTAIFLYIEAQVSDWFYNIMNVEDYKVK